MLTFLQGIMTYYLILSGQLWNSLQGIWILNETFKVLLSIKSPPSNEYPSF